MNLDLSQSSGPDCIPVVILKNCDPGLSSNSSKILLLRDHNGNKDHNLLFLCNPYHQVSVIKDLVSYSLVFYC